LNAFQESRESRMTLDAKIPDDLPTCQALIETQSETIEVQQQLIEKLQHEVGLLKRHIFGQRRERFIDPRQGHLFEIDQELEDALQSDEDDDEQPPSRPPRKGHGRRRLPENLVRHDKTYELKPEELPCPCCGKPRCKVSEAISQQLEFQPATLFVIRHIRYTYACQEEGCDPNMVTAPKPPQAIEKGLAGPGLLAFVGASKLADHLPLNRQEDILARFGVHISRSTQCDWMAACAQLVRPLYDLMLALALQSKVLASDDTTVKLRDNQLDHTRTAYFWAYVGDNDHPYVCYDFTTSHSRDGPIKILKGFEGYLQGDAYSGYIHIADTSDGKIQFAGCWSHARRYFDRARTTPQSDAVHQALAYVKRLYAVEDQAAEMESESRLRHRQQKSVPILKAFRDWLGQQQALPESPFGKAINYTLNHWEALCLFTTDGDIPLDNNRTEHALRQQVIGRLNWLFVGSEGGGHTAAVLYTLVATCKRLRIDPFAYLRDVFSRLPEDSTDEALRDLLPDRWIDQNPQHRLAHRVNEDDQAKERRRKRRDRKRQLAQANAE
jgi:transposase